MGWSMVVGLVLLPAAAFSVAYPSLVNRYSRGLVSSYAKAEARKRLIAAGIDGLIATTLMVTSATTGIALYFGLSAGYLLLRDAVGGRSIGKLVLGLIVIDLQSGRPTSWFGSAQRNIVLLLPGANVAAVFLEGRTILVDPQGQRLGDRLAQTQVVEGAGARDLARRLRDWLLHLGDVVGQVPGRRPTVHERFDPAA
jgi:uncharacterized RDD family membrane protein YckC